MLDFLAHLEFERGLSRNTLAAYRTDLLQLGRSWPRERDATDATAGDLSDFLALVADGDGNGTPPSSTRDDQPQGRLPALLLPPPAPRGADLRRPGRRARDAAARQEAARGPELRRGPEAARPAAGQRADRLARSGSARADVRVRAAGLGDDLARVSATWTSTTASCVRGARARRSAWSPSAARRSPRSASTCAPVARRWSATTTSASSSSTSAAAR